MHNIINIANSGASDTRKHFGTSEMEHLYMSVRLLAKKEQLKQHFRIPVELSLKSVTCLNSKVGKEQLSDNNSKVSGKQHGNQGEQKDKKRRKEVHLS